MNPQGFGFLLISILANIAVQFFLKKATEKLGQVRLSDFFSNIWSFVTMPELQAGIACAVLATIAYFFLLTRVQLSIAGPASALLYVLSVALGHFVFKEPVPFTNLVGLGLIVCGIVLVSSKS